MSGSIRKDAFSSSLNNEFFQTAGIWFSDQQIGKSLYRFEDKFFTASRVRPLNQHDRYEYDDNPERLQRPQQFSQRDCGNHDAEHGLETTHHDRASRLQILQTGEVTRKRTQ